MLTAPVLHAVSGFNKRKYFEKYRCIENKESASQAATVDTKRNIVARQDVYDYGIGTHSTRRLNLYGFLFSTCFNMTTNTDYFNKFYLDVH